MSYKEGDRVQFIYKKNMLLPENANQIGTIVRKIVENNSTISYYIKIGSRTTILSSWYLANFSKPINLYHYGI